MKRLISTQELATYYGYSTQTIQNWIKRGLPVADKTGNRNRFDLEEVKKWRKEQQSNRDVTK